MIIGFSLRVRIVQIVLLALVMFIAMGDIQAQTCTYYIQLTDKKHNSYTIDRPEAFLSAKSIERRRLQGIPIQEDDLPVSASYLQHIAPLCHISYPLKWSNGVVIRSDDPAIVSRLSNFPFIASVTRISNGGPSTRHKELDYTSTAKREAATIDSTYYGAATRQTMMIHLDALHERGYWGDGVIIGMMDAGFQNANVNPFFASTFTAGRVLYTWDFVFEESDVYAPVHADSHGGETFSCIAANEPHTMVGTAPNADFLLFHTEDVRSETLVEEYNWAAAAERGDSLGAEVFSTSLGYTTFDNSDTIDNHTYADMTGHTTAIAKAVNKAASKGILVINSAGNEGAATWHYVATPGDADSGVTAGAVTPAALVAAFSSRGPNSSGQVKPDLCVQGGPASVVNTNGMVTTANGTSFSCPITAGAFACLRQAFPSAPNMVIVEAVRQSCHLYNTPNADYGYGVPDFGDAYERLKVLYPADTISFVTYTQAFPNPFTTSLNVVMTDQLQNPVSTAELYDLSGQKVWSTSAPATSFTIHHIWELSIPASLAQGIYILSINKAKKFRLVRK